MRTPSPPLPVLAGPTAVGKTALSLSLAERFGVEIISADSRQVYRSLTIGTAKPAPEVLARYPHHFIDERDLNEPYSAGTFAREANERIRRILARGRCPLVVGGSTLYLHALLHGLADVPPVPGDVREELEARLALQGADALFEELRRVDPRAAATMDPSKTQRVVRALEVYHGTGRLLSDYHAEQHAPPFSFRTAVLCRPRAELYARINRRVDAMLANGLLDEVRGLLEGGLDPAHNALQTIGYREPIAYLHGEIGYDEMVRRIKRNTRRYAKRQLAWFRRYPEYTWLEADAGTGPLAGFFGLQ